MLSYHHRLVSDVSGNILPMTAVGMIMLAALVGGSVDLSRAYRVQNRLQAACDAGVLAGRKAVAQSGFDSTASNQADAYFHANFDTNSSGTSETLFAPSSDDDGNSVEAAATTSMETTIMGVFGVDEIDLSVACQASMGVGNSDITMVLDTTGSMAWDLSDDTSRIDALRAAMKNFYDTVAESSDGSNSRIRYSFVPYSSTVNVGELLIEEDPSYVADSYTYQSRQWVVETRRDNILVGYGEPFSDTETSYSDEDPGNWSRHSDTRYRSSDSCVAALPANVDWADRGSPNVDNDEFTNAAGQQVTITITEQEQRKTNYACSGSGTRYYIDRMRTNRIKTTTVTETATPIYQLGNPYTVTEMQYKPVLFNTSTFKTFASTTTPTGTSGANQSSTWNGCILERQTTAASAFSFSSGAGITPSGALDLDIDRAPTSSDPTTQWAPMWTQVTYIRGNWVYPWRGSPYISMVDQSPLTNGQLISSACPVGAQLLAEMDETDFDEYADSLNPVGSTYHDIGILWGARLASPTGIFADNVNEEPDNASTVSRHMIFMTDGEMAPSSSAYSAYGIEFYDKRVTGGGSGDLIARHNSRFLALCEAVKARGVRLWVIAMATGLSSELSTCASPASSFTVDNAASLNTAFEEIANQVGELRVTT